MGVDDVPIELMKDEMAGQITTFIVQSHIFALPTVEVTRRSLRVKKRTTLQVRSICLVTNKGLLQLTPYLVLSSVKGKTIEFLVTAGAALIMIANWKITTIKDTLLKNLKEKNMTTFHNLVRLRSITHKTNEY